MVRLANQRELAVIAGCGSMGARIALMLSEQGKDVKVIDTSSSSFQKLAKNHEIEQIEADATDIAILKRSGIEHASIFLAATNKDKTNVMIAEIVKQVFKVKTVIARIYDYHANAQFMNGSDVIPIYPYLLTANELTKCFADEIRDPI